MEFLEHSFLRAKRTQKIYEDAVNFCKSNLNKLNLTQIQKFRTKKSIYMKSDALNDSNSDSENEN